VRHTGATGERQKEGGKINQSLLTLSRVIAALGQPNNTHVNFRDSKLTRILQPSLSGNARMAVICCATPSELYLEETRSTLQFASRAKLVKTNAQINEVLDDRALIKKLQKELAEARKMGGGKEVMERIRLLEVEAVNAGNAAKDAEEKLSRLKSSILRGGMGIPSRSHVSSQPIRMHQLPVIYNSESDAISVPINKSNPPLSPEIRTFVRKKRRLSDGALNIQSSVELFDSPVRKNSKVELNAPDEVAISTQMGMTTTTIPWSAEKPRPKTQSQFVHQRTLLLS